MAAKAQLPTWAEELRRRYLRGESHLFVVHGNVHDVTLYEGELLGISAVLAHAMAGKDIILRYNVSTGVRVMKKPPQGLGKIEGVEELLLHRSADKVLPALEKLLFAQHNIGVIFEYTETIAPAGDASFSSATRCARASGWWRRWRATRPASSSPSSPTCR